MDELVLGFESRLRPNTFLRIAAIGRLDADLVGVVDTGVEVDLPIIAVPDHGIDTVGSGTISSCSSSTDRRRRSAPTSTC